MDIMDGGEDIAQRSEAQQNGWLQSHAMVAKDEVFFSSVSLRCR
jgi:hypothetical protein